MLDLLKALLIKIFTIIIGIFGILAILQIILIVKIGWNFYNIRFEYLKDSQLYIYLAIIIFISRFPLFIGRLRAKLRGEL